MSEMIQESGGFYILIDYDNIRSNTTATREETELLLEDLWDQLVQYITDEHPQTTDVDVLLYGGWLHEGGTYSDLASWIRVLVSNFRGRRRGIRFRPVVVETLLSVPSTPLLGTVRSKRRGLQQKMVDSMLSCDLIHLALDRGNVITVVSDDDDFVPASLYGASCGESMIILLRNRENGRGMNDAALCASGVKIATREIA